MGRAAVCDWCCDHRRALGALTCARRHRAAAAATNWMHPPDGAGGICFQWALPPRAGRALAWAGALRPTGAEPPVLVPHCRPRQHIAAPAAAPLAFLPAQDGVNLPDVTQTQVHGQLTGTRVCLLASSCAVLYGWAGRQGQLTQAAQACALLNTTARQCGEPASHRLPPWSAGRVATPGARSSAGAARAACRRGRACRARRSCTHAQ